MSEFENQVLKMILLTEKLLPAYQAEVQFGHWKRMKNDKQTMMQ